MAESLVDVVLLFCCHGFDEDVVCDVVDAMVVLCDALAMGMA